MGERDNLSDGWRALIEVHLCDYSGDADDVSHPPSRTFYGMCHPKKNFSANSFEAKNLKPDHLHIK